MDKNKYCKGTFVGDLIKLLEYLSGAEWVSTVARAITALIIIALIIGGITYSSVYESELRKLDKQIKLANSISASACTLCKGVKIEDVEKCTSKIIESHLNMVDKITNKLSKEG